MARLNFSIEVPAGTYYFGDPCYAVPNSLWDQLLNVSGFFDTSPCGTVAGQTVYAASTQYGDGVYSDSLGRDFPVDAGLIGLTPLKLAELKTEAYKKGKLEIFGSHLITLDKPTMFGRDSEGMLSLGDVRLPTGYEEEDPDEYEED